MVFKYVDCNKNPEKELDEGLAKRFENTYRFCDGVINKFCLILRRGVYRYDYIDSWPRFNETFLPYQKGFYSNLIVENITDADCKYAKRVCENFGIQNLGEFHDLEVHLPQQVP